MALQSSVGDRSFSFTIVPRSERGSNYPRALPVLGSALLALSLLGWRVDLRQPLRGDEIHFVQTIEKFGKTPGLKLLKHYEEMSGPLPFALYGAWGRCFGYEPLVLRFLSIAIAAATMTLWFRMSLRETTATRDTWLATACLVLQPYMLFVSLFVYTDMLALLMMLVAIVGLRDERPWLLLAGIAGALLCRQHLAFLALAAGLYLVLRLFARPCRRDLVLLVACCGGMLPLGGLILLWGGPCPDNLLKQTYLSDGTRFHAASAWLYVGLSAIYFAPALLAQKQIIFGSRRRWIVAIPLSFFYWLNPIAPSPSSIAAGIPHVGMFHKGVAALVPFESGIQCIFWGIAIPGLILFLYLAGDIFRRISRRSLDFALFLDLAAISFLFVMPWAYLHWEKYLLPLAPILIARLLWGETSRAGFALRELAFTK